MCASVIYNLCLLAHFSSIVRAETTIVSCQTYRDPSSKTEVDDFMWFIAVTLSLSVFTSDSDVLGFEPHFGRF